MLKKVSSYIQQISTGRNYLVMLAIFIGVNLFLALSPVSPIARMTAYSGGSILDMEFNYSADRAYQVLDAYGVDGRAFFVSTLVVIDTFTPILMNLFLSMTISLVFRQAFSAESRLQLLNLLPFVAMLGDYFENLGIVLIIRSYPARVDTLAHFAALSTNTKFVFTFASGFCIFLGLVIWLIKRRK
jgi:hypothetical protein